jgi:hypothetical protein
MLLSVSKAALLAKWQKLTLSSHPLLYLIAPAENARPFKTIAMDFITKLPPSRGIDTILTITDTDCSKAFIFILCNENPCFTSRFGQALCQVLDIWQNISTVYHPQTDGTSKYTNQSLEQYLRLYCSTKQNSWHTWLPITQYIKNSWLFTTTKKAPFNLLIKLWVSTDTPLQSISWLEKQTSLPLTNNSPA